MHTASANDLVAVVMYHPKDWELLDYCLRGIKNNTGCAKIYVVGRNSERTRVSNLDPCVSYIDENSVVPGLTLESSANPRWGWYLQQILKLSLADALPEPCYLTVDADTVFLRKVNFFADGKPLYATGTEHHLPYFRFFERALGWKANREFSFIAHHMVFSSALVREMLGRFKCKKVWWEPVLECLPAESTMSFSEFETYGHYLKQMHPDAYKLRPLRWRNVPGKPSFLKLKALSLIYDFCSFHSYTRKASQADILLRLLRKPFCQAA